MYTQISLLLSAFSLHIAIASLIACSFAFVVIILSEMLVALLNLTSSCIIFFNFFIKCMQSMTMTLSRRCAYVRLHVS